MKPFLALLFATATLLGTSCAHRGPAAPLPEGGVVLEYEVPWADAFPSDIALDDEGRVWFTDRLTHAIGRLDPETGEFERFPTPTEKSAPYGFVRGPDGALWFAESRQGRLGRVDPATGAITEALLRGVTYGGPHLLVAEGDRIWFTLREASAYGSYDVGTGATAVYRTPEMKPYGIAADGRGHVWIGAYDGYRVLEIDVRTDSVRQHELLFPDSAGMRMLESVPDSLRARYAHVAMHAARLRRMSAGPERVWLSDFGRGRVLALRSDDDVDQFPSLQRTSEPYGILVSHSGLVWYNEKRNDEVVALDPATGARSRYRIPTKGSAVRQIAEDVERGRIWLPLSDHGRIGLIPLRPDALPAALKKP